MALSLSLKQSSRCHCCCVSMGLLLLLLLCRDSYAYLSSTSVPRRSHRQMLMDRTITTTTTQSACYGGIARPGRDGTALYALSKRELEIRRKIKALKQEGRMKYQTEADDDDDDEEYLDKIRQKLGTAKSKMLGFEGGSEGGEQRMEETEDQEKKSDGAVEAADQQDDKDADPSSRSVPQQRRQAQIGAIPSVSDNDNDSSDTQTYQRVDQTESATSKSVMDADTETDSTGSSDTTARATTAAANDNELSEEDLVELVAKRMQAKRDAEEREKEERLQRIAAERLARMEEERQQELKEKAATKAKQTTSGIGGSWDGPDDETKEDVYQPKSGSWGAFPRPRDISKAYGGGRRVGPGYSNEKARSKSVDETREKLQKYRVKVGIDVESEKEHAGEIEEAMGIADRAMQRGMYTTAVSSLEKVTKYCSTNSKVGGQVFLELAMAYEAAGRPKEAITVYTTLSRCRIEEIKINAKRLLYGIEAMQFMQENVSASEFSRKRAKNTFIDTTGLANIASHFDDVYETAYIDMDRGFYKKLTKSVVRSSREARQILLSATQPGEVERERIVQALRSLSRRFAEDLQKEIDKAQIIAEPTAVMNGKPIMQHKEDVPESDRRTSEFLLLGPEQMLDNLTGEWRLQLIADKRGDGVKFFDSSLAWQIVDTAQMKFSSQSPQGFLSVDQKGSVTFNSERRILRRHSVEVSGGGGMFTNLFGAKTGPVGAIRTEQQIVIVDAVLLVTQGVPNRRSANKADEKDYFAVWRKVNSGTYSKS